MIDISHLITYYDSKAGTIDNAHIEERRLSDLKGCFADEAAYQRELEKGDPLIYSTTSVIYSQTEGQLAFGIGKILPGKIGREYYLTKGHYHAWRPAAEVYICLTGNGQMILESQDGDLNDMVPLLPDSIIYVPGYTAHRTVNTGTKPLVYLGIYPAQAGHDYASISERNFQHIIVDLDGKPTLIERNRYLKQYLA